MPDGLRFIYMLCGVRLRPLHVLPVDAGRLGIPGDVVTVNKQSEYGAEPTTIPFACPECDLLTHDVRLGWIKGVEYEMILCLDGWPVLFHVRCRCGTNFMIEEQVGHGPAESAWCSRVML